mmetsp:Transcript_71949/g.232792  ORF Transcript_71949/g.232792 Transcript_71949/m.232792 type:complete len:363 (-) Transcript_71949:158-1246(-)
MMSAGLAARQFVQPARHLSATLSAGLATRQFQRSFGPMGVQPARVAGVDLNLDEFNLSAPTQLERENFCVQLEDGADISGAFWQNLRNDAPSMFSEEDKRLLRRIFNPRLSDRSEEGDVFIPPETSSAYVQKLRCLVNEEETLMQQRKDHFFSKAFNQEQPGSLFPSSWMSSVEISRQETTTKPGSTWHARPDLKAQAHMFEQALESAVPVFEKSTEDGTQFRIYRFGSLEVRTTQDEGFETIGAVFSRTSMDAPQKQHDVKENEKIVKATEYVERSGKGHRCYVVLETEHKNSIVAEEIANGTVEQQANPKDLEDRISLAKVLRTMECSGSKLTFKDITNFQGDMYGLVTGKVAETGFRMK